MDSTIDINSIENPNIATVGLPTTIYDWNSSTIDKSLFPLWESFRTALEKGDNSCRQHFQVFARKFIALYKDWCARDEAECLHFPTELCPRLIDWLSVAHHANASLQELSNEFLVLEILSRSCENRRYLRYASFIQLCHVWLRQLLHTFPSDDVDDMLSFGTPSTAHNNTAYIRILNILLVIIDHWLCLPYPVHSGFPLFHLISLADSIILEECKLDVSVELSILLVKAQHMMKEEWTAVIQHLLRLVIGSIGFCSTLQRRVQLDKMLREIKLNNVTGSQLIRMYEDTTVSSSLLLNGYYDVFLILLFQLKKEQISSFLIKIIQNLPSIKQSHLLHLFLTVLMNYSQFLTAEQVQSILLPFFSSFSSILSSPDELGLRQHFLLVLYQFVKVHPSIIPQLHSFIHMESLESFLTIHSTSQIDSSLLTLIISVFTYTPLQVTFSPAIPPSTILLYTHCQSINSSLLVHYTDLYIHFLKLILYLPEDQCLSWLPQIYQLIQNEWNCKLLSNHPSFFNQLLIKYQTAESLEMNELVFKIMECLLAYSIPPSALSSLLSYFTEESMNSQAILLLLNHLYSLPSSQSEILLDKDSSIQIIADHSTSIQLPNKDDWCFMMEFRCLTNDDCDLIVIKEEPNELILHIHDGQLQLLANRLFLIQSIPFTSSSWNTISLVHRTSIPSSFILNNNTPIKIALPLFTQPSITLHSSLIAISSITMTSNKNNTPFFTFIPSLLKNNELINKEIPITVKKNSFLPLKNKQDNTIEMIPEIRGSIESLFLMSKNIHISTSIQSLGGVSILFPLLFTESEDDGYFSSVFTLLRQAMKYATDKDWKLLTECLVRVDDSILSKHISKLMNYEHGLPTEIVNRPSTIECIQDLKVDDAIERCLQCLCCEEVSVTSKQYDGYEEWCVKEKEALANAWSTLITIDQISKDKNHFGMFLQLLREGLKEESSICDHLLPFLQEKQILQACIDYLKHSIEYAECEWNLFTPFLLSLQSCSNPTWFTQLFSFTMELFTFCHTHSLWNDMKMNKNDCMVILYQLKQLYHELEQPLSPSLFTNCIINQLIEKEEDLLTLLQYPNWFLPISPNQYKPLLLLLIEKGLANQLPYSMNQCILSLLVFIQSTLPNKGISIFVDLLAAFEVIIPHIIETKRWVCFGQIFEFLYKELVYYTDTDMSEITNDTLLMNWKVFEGYLRCLYLFPKTHIVSLLSSLFVKLLPYLRFITQAVVEEEEEEDLLFGLSASSEQVHEEAMNENCSRESLTNGITQETQEYMLNTMKQLILQLVMVSDLAHLHLLQTQLQEYKCIPRDVIQSVLSRQIQIMNEELKRNKSKSQLIRDFLNEVSQEEQYKRMNEYLTVCGIVNVQWVIVDETQLRTSLEQLSKNAFELLHLHLQDQSPINQMILLEHEKLIHLMDSLFIEWFIKKQERVQLYQQLQYDMMNEESIWYSADSTQVFSICSNVTKNMIHPQIEIHYMKQFSTLHSAASVWENDKSTMTPISPTPTSSSPLLLSQTLPFALLTLSCSLIKPLQVIQGTLYLSKDSLTFIVDPELKKEREEKIKQLDKKIKEGRKGENKWTLLDELKNEIWEIKTLQAEEFRLYQFRDIALELFFKNGDSVFLSFLSIEERNRFHAILRTLKLPYLEPFLGVSAEERWKKDDCYDRWCKGELSNFDYLMRINRLAGRSLNDLSQYYIMPWVLKDYESPTLDLHDESVYRDFSKPIGAQLDYRCEILKEKYEMMKSLYETSEKEETDPLQLLSPPPRYFSTFYSNSSYVIWYLLRIEPFTSYHVFLQDGRFDRPDRQFYSIQSAYQGSTTNDGDCKELIPEFYYCPSMFMNCNKLNLGYFQDSSKAIDHVELPPWANNSADFVIQMREALESDYVTKHLNEWIDLIFGFKQRGKEAVQQYNVFNHIAYLTKDQAEQILVKYPDCYSQAASIAENFGILPQQITQVPLKKTKKSSLLTNTLLSVNQNWVDSSCSFIGVDSYGEFKVLATLNMQQFNIIAAVVVNPTTIIGVSNKGAILTFSVKPPTTKQPSFSISLDGQTILGNWKSLASTAVSQDGSYVLLTDFGGIRKYNKNGEFIQCVDKERLFIQCDISQDNEWIGGICDDGSVSIYSKDMNMKIYEFRIKNDFITQFALNTELMICSVVGHKGAITLFSLFNGKSILSLHLSVPVSWCSTTSYSTIVTYSASVYTLSIYTFTGDLIYSREILVEPNEFKMIDGKYLLITSSKKPILVNLKNLCDC